MYREQESMKLRRQPKQKQCYEAGPVRNVGKKYHQSLKRIEYIKSIRKQAAIDANMIKVLTIAKSDNPSLHLNFWQENLKSDYPVIEIKKSNLKNGGLGVFVTDNCIFLPKGLMYLPNVDGQPRDAPAEVGTTMSNYQFSITLGSRTKYIFPTLDPDNQLP